MPRREAPRAFFEKNTVKFCGDHFFLVDMLDCGRADRQIIERSFFMPVYERTWNNRGVSRSRSSYTEQKNNLQKVSMPSLIKEIDNNCD